jgi:hypothetical protein
MKNRCRGSVRPIRRICALEETDARNYCNACKMHLDDLAEGIPVRLGSVLLPPGRLVRPRLNSPTPGTPVLWATDDAVERPGVLWQELTNGAPQSGLVPIILDNLPGPGTPGRPWDSGEFDPQPVPRPDDLDEAVVFRQCWNKDVPVSLLAPEDRRPTFPGFGPSPFVVEDDDDDEEKQMFLERVAPWGVGFPGLALAERIDGDPDTLSREVEDTPPGRIGLVETARSADIPYVIGWLGAVNHFVSEAGAAPLSVMLRSWEERFAARLFRLGFATMTLRVERPPSTESAALAVAAEHFAFAGTDGFQAYRPPLHVNSIRSLASALLNRPSWSFWFD